MPVTKCSNMLLKRDGRGEKSPPLITGVSGEPCFEWVTLLLCEYQLNVSSLSGLFISVIEEANWLTLPEDVKKPGDGFDAVICLGNSFAHLPDFKGKNTKAKKNLIFFLRIFLFNHFLISHRGPE